MSDPIGGILPQPIQPARKAGPVAGAPQQVDGKTFQDVLKEYVNRVNEMKKGAEHGVEDLALGRTENVDEVMAEVKKADLAFKTLMQIRNKVLDAYQEISRMRV